MRSTTTASSLTSRDPYESRCQVPKSAAWLPANAVNGMPPTPPGEQELERVHGVPHDGALADAVAQRSERLADEAGEGQRRVERAAEVRPLDAEVRELVRGLQHEVPPGAHIGDGRRIAARGLCRAASAQSWARVEGVATSHAERFARISSAGTPFSRIWSERTSQQARAPVDAPNMSIFDRPDNVTTRSRHSGFAKAGLTNEST